MSVYLKILPVKGAATYQAEKLANNQWVIVMYPEGDKNGTVIDKAKSFETANSKADKWQIKENRAVLKSQKLKS